MFPYPWLAIIEWWRSLMPPDPNRIIVPVMPQERKPMTDSIARYADLAAMGTTQPTEAPSRLPMVTAIAAVVTVLLGIWIAIDTHRTALAIDAVTATQVVQGRNRQIELEQLASHARVIRHATEAQQGVARELIERLEATIKRLEPAPVVTPVKPDKPRRSTTPAKSAGNPPRAAPAATGFN